MRFSPSFLEEIRARLPVSEVVRRRVKLARAGREWRGLSPFTTEKSPSFFVNDQKMAWFDFSAGKNGNIFDFVMETEGLSFPEAVERLAGEAGLPLPVASAEDTARERQRASLHEVLEWAAQAFEQELQSPRGARARGYLADRGLAPALQRQFRVGYAGPERFALRDHLASRGVGAEAMIEAGLLVHGEDIAVPYDRFRDRVIFPIADRSGKIVAFGGRALAADAQAKYLNSPETPLFHKGAMLYNHHAARKAAHDRGTVVAVEGYVDVISFSAAGFPNVVAPLGTALTAEQCNLLWAMSEAPILCFDGDKAGRKAAYRAIEVALPLLAPQRSFRFALLPDGQDPDDLARSGGTEAVAAVLAAARPLADILWMRETDAGPLDTPEQRAGLERRLLETVAGIGDETLRRYYREDMLARLGRSGGASRQPQRPAPTHGKWRGRPPQPPPHGYVTAPLAPSQSLLRSTTFAGRAGIPHREAEILLNLVHHPALLAHFAEEVADLELTSRDAAKLRDCLLGLTMDFSGASAIPAVAEAGFGPLLARIESAAQPVPWSILPSAADTDAETVLRQALGLHRRARALHRELKQAETALAQDATEASWERLREILAELSAIEGKEAAVEGFGVSSGRQTPAL